MNGRGQYAGQYGSRSSARPGMQRPGTGQPGTGQQRAELHQRFEGVDVVGARALLNVLSRDGAVTTIGPNRWEVALREGPRVRLGWDPNFRILNVTITDNQPRAPQQVWTAKKHFAKILREKIASRLSRFGAVAVGLSLYHSVEDRATAVKQLDVDWNALYQSLASQAGELTADPTSSSGYRYTTQKEWDANPPDPKRVTWWKAYASPLIKQWVKFKHEQLGGDRTLAADYTAFAERFQTNWDVYEDWKKKLDTLRAEAQHRGFVLNSPSTTPLPTTIWTDAAQTVEKGVGDVWRILKYGAWGLLGVGAIVALSSIAQNLRSGRDPAEKYMEIFKARRPRVPGIQRALLAPARAALPSGEAPMGVV